MTTAATADRDLTLVPCNTECTRYYALFSSTVGGIGIVLAIIYMNKLTAAQSISGWIMLAVNRNLAGGTMHGARLVEYSSSLDAPIVEQIEAREMVGSKCGVIDCL